MNNLVSRARGFWSACASITLGVLAAIPLTPAAQAMEYGVEVNGACEFGSCPPDVIPQISGTPFVPYAFETNLANGDSFRIEGSLLAAMDGSERTIQAFSVTYLGNPAGQAAQGDILTIDNLFAFGSPQNPASLTSSANGAFQSVALTSSVQVKYIFTTSTGNTLTEDLGSFPAPNSYFVDAGPTSLENPGTELSLDSNYTVVFAPGSPVGSVIETGNTASAPISMGASILPGDRSVTVGQQATVFATVLNTSPWELPSCGIYLPQSIPAGLGLTFQTTDATTNALTGSANQPVTIPLNGSQTFLLSFSSTAPLTETALPLLFGCDGIVPAPIVPGVNTIDLLFSSTPIADIIALAATATNDGTVHVANGVGAFAVATDNVGTDGMLTVSADTGSAALPVAVALCQTNSTTGQCIAPPATSVPVDFAAGGVPTFSIFVSATAPVAFAPGTSRIFVRFEDSSGASHGSTSVAVTTN